MPKRRNDRGSRGFAVGAAKIVKSLLWLLWVRAARRPIDSFAIFAAGAASFFIIVNAIALQSGPRPAKFVVNVTALPPVRSPVHSTAQAAPPPRVAESKRTPYSVAGNVDDPIAQFLGTSSRVLEVQRALSDYGYGQIKPTGILDRPTSVAIEKFEREHGMPVTGRISNRLVGELTQMIGHPISKAADLRLAR
ncbi:MAG: peptidoglycan-binding domain-containing protein [Xanthobacteraceae bacterium]